MSEHLRREFAARSERNDRGHRPTSIALRSLTAEAALACLSTLLLLVAGCATFGSALRERPERTIAVVELGLLTMWGIDNDGSNADLADAVDLMRDRLEARLAHDWVVVPQATFRETAAFRALPSLGSAAVLRGRAGSERMPWFGDVPAISHGARAPHHAEIETFGEARDLPVEVAARLAEVVGADLVMTVVVYWNHKYRPSRYDNRMGAPSAQARTAIHVYDRAGALVGSNSEPGRTSGLDYSMRVSRDTYGTGLRAPGVFPPPNVADVSIWLTAFDRSISRSLQ